ncbi:Uncharacterized protein OS=Singulisphaera acidiphila (strain ATCC BAA-1392 / DSM 18658 / VKM B-2454 / MOB10) GN=Sinac_3213 PE=4 SV=1: DUF885 [Gemmataceae bacterium]|nr:Uncharacterized protein OS=Singulisphaera acidiphila (strain ATCC BAA-1392 / DSM 18658 / VKM B-2454 / MOB10) GN=Sinac_3213 PE=4 SV=1: DUF885 [Gemmataceae bacterium]VTU01596.1 Uncharacterized protein OS=Singulisphaera acidiphila (strain ATCC BAA-1392 / DSM 18658 / VKM B-2454 / MOB10) GN=Sinac_3213 PE=4 SV=1: DUF885 [Gemmataceae bacterium]
MLRTAIPVLLLGAALMALPDPTPAAQPKPAEPVKEDDVLKKLFLAWLAEEFEAHPLYATQQGNHEYDDRIDDLSPEARAKDLDRTRTWLARLPKSLDRSDLSRNAQIDYDIWTHSLNYAVWSAENDNRFVFDPRAYGEYVSDGVFLLLTQSTLPRERNVANAAKRIALIPKVLTAARASLKNPPKELTQVAIKRNLGAIAFYEKEVYTVAGETPGSEPLATPCRAAVKALQNYQTYLETELLPKSNGEWRLGKEKFGKKLELELDAGLTADQVLKLAEDEADRVEREMWYVAKQLWAKLFPGKPVPPDDAPGRRAAIQAVLDELGKDHGKPEDLVSDARKTVANIKAFIRDKKILTLPDPDTCKIVEMPEFQRGFSLAYLNPAPPLDPKADSYYAIAPPPADWSPERVEALLREYNAAMLQVLTIHEAYPGHYVQLAYSNRNPSLVRKVLWSGTFAEGWAVYTEQMMLDQGYGGGDLSLRLHQLKFYQRAVLNAILDHKMHCTQFGDAEAKKMLMERGFQTEAEALGKVSRAKQSSTQLSTYFVGRTAFYKLRQEVSRAKGDKFDLGKFHEAVLSHGTLPVKYLPELVK